MGDERSLWPYANRTAEEKDQSEITLIRQKAFLLCWSTLGEDLTWLGILVGQFCLHLTSLSLFLTSVQGAHDSVD